MDIKDEYYKRCLDELTYIIPKKEYEEVMSQHYCELDKDFLGFVSIYKSLSLIIPKEMTVIDFGCYLAAQSYYFAQHKRYIGVDVVKLKRFSPDNALHYVCPIKEFIANEFDRAGTDGCFAICSYVPDFHATELVRKTFRNVFCFYPTLM